MASLLPSGPGAAPSGELVRLAYYPFLPEVREAVREAGPGLDTLLASPLYEGARLRAMERIEGALGDGFPAAAIVDERSALLELLSIPVARMAAVLLGDLTLIKRYAAAEAARVRAALARDPDPEALPRAAAALGIPAEATGEGFRLHFSDYVRLAPTHNAGWKLILRSLDAGFLPLAHAELARLCEEALARRIAQELEAERTRPLPPEARQALAPLVARLEPKLEEARANWSTGDFGPVQPHLFPPCIKEVFEGLKRSENVPHHGRFAFATFLHTVGWNSEQILDYLSATPNFDREKSRYQIEHVSGAKSVQAYTPPGCATMQTNGVCPLAKRDSLCARVKHPLSYYRSQLRRQQRDQERAAASAPSQAPDSTKGAQAAPAKEAAA
ncbi:MAG TPA: DNA primase large subunit PriL [Candidatus Thermoplasmatota archaeon]|nr:DNA primase large subunit PriL [Candidatus Thermoplasmatota archaeon]